MSDLLTKNIDTIRSALDSGQVSAPELVKESLSRIEANKSLNAFITVCNDQAIKDAEVSQKMISQGQGKTKKLLGIPVAIKDMILTKGVRTTAASKILDNFVAPYDATVVHKLKEDGAIIVGKTNLDEFAMGSSNENSFFGPCGNPWDPSCVPGGSSGGSAVAVASRMVVGALGTDTGGSVRQPASLTSTVGIKPTYGRVSRYGVVAYASSLDQVGVFAPNVKDAAIILSTISGSDPSDSTTVNEVVPNWDDQIAKGVKGLRIGIPKEYFISGLNSEVESSVRKALLALEKLGAKLVEISLPHTEVALATYYVIAPAEASSNLARYDGVRFGPRAQQAKDLMDLYCRTRADGFGEEVTRRIMIGTYVLSSGYFDAYYLKAQKVRALVAKDFTTAFQTSCDFIACPASPTTAFKIGEKVSDPLTMYLSDIFTIPASLAGLPGISVPCGFDSKGLPIGIQLIGKPFDEATILKAAYSYEQETQCTAKVPPNVI